MTFILRFRMAWLCQLTIVFGLLGALNLYGQHKLGYIQVTCEPGVRIFLDGELKGITTAAQGGLILSSVPATRHQLRFEKDGCHLQLATVEVGSVEVLEYKVRSFTPKQDGGPAGPVPAKEEQKSGSLLIESLPVACKITIAGLGVQGYEKYRDQVEFDKLPAGTYSATFSALDKSVERTFAIKDGESTHLFVNITETEEPPVRAGPQTEKTISEPTMDAVAGGPAVAEIEPNLKSQVPEANVPPQVVPPQVVQELPATPPQVPQELPAIPPDVAENRSVEDLDLKLVWIRPGSFTMGNGLGGENDERPATQVRLSRGFWLGATEVTQGQWAEIMDGNPAQFQADNLPVEEVNWKEAMDFCRKLTERERAADRLPSGYIFTLPTEAQWEYACRAGTSGDYAGVLPAMAWFVANSDKTTKPVGLKQANAWGLFDMHGNVWEWCLDWYGNYPGGNVVDPKGAKSGIYRVIRGGSWNNSAQYCRAGLRLRDEPQYRRNYLGFRVALSPIP